MPTYSVAKKIIGSVIVSLYWNRDLRGRVGLNRLEECSRSFESRATATTS
jgi:hypothetical protein